MRKYLTSAALAIPFLLSACDGRETARERHRRERIEKQIQEDKKQARKDTKSEESAAFDPRKLKIGECAAVDNEFHCKGEDYSILKVDAISSADYKVHNPLLDTKISKIKADAVSSSDHLGKDTYASQQPKPKKTPQPNDGTCKYTPVEISDMYTSEIDVNGYIVHYSISDDIDYAFINIGLSDQENSFVVAQMKFKNARAEKNLLGTIDTKLALHQKMDQKIGLRGMLEKDVLQVFEIYDNKRVIANAYRRYCRANKK